MTTRPANLSDISTNEANGSSTHLTAGSGARKLRVASIENDNSDDFKESASADFDDDDDIPSYQRILLHQKKEMLLSWLSIAIEGDLAGFQIAWLCMSIGFIVLKIAKITEIVSTIPWWAVFTIPIGNAVLTAWFDYIIRKYRSSRAVESLKKTRFVLLWGIKMVAAIYVTSYWVWGSGSFMQRYQNTPKYQLSKRACNGQIVCIYIAMLGAVAMAEMMISTVLINSEQGLSDTRTPRIYRWILLFIRPIVWVYNRTMVMFLCFYAIYGLMYSVFVVALLADYLCDSVECQDAQSVGLKMLTVPFTVPQYLSEIQQVFSSWDDVKNEDFLTTFVVVFLCQSFYVDCLNSLWQFSRRYLRPNSLRSGKSLHGAPTSPADIRLMNELAKELPHSPSPIPLMDLTTTPNGDSFHIHDAKTIALK